MLLCGNCSNLFLCVAFADFTIHSHPQHVMGGVSNLSAALAAQLSATAGTNYSAGLQGYHGALSGGTPCHTGEIYMFLSSYLKKGFNIAKTISYRQMDI